ncbi:patatin [Sphingomonas oleivorans]|uniref:Patatin n=1 Tax=Sphingomonas oleivorans TaxID=1735121 RepID=A0A2T5FXC5_9SPHN|nr:patatin-like phospholipase family protein [Sphingomonas oleivorans]PTQ10768.1 patatin [Sphingomonas oleivorans]
MAFRLPFLSAEGRPGRPSDVRGAEPEGGRQAIALALGGGAALGWAHIGVLRALIEAKVEVRAVAGTSIGALAGVCFAADRLDVLEEIARTATLRTILRYLDPHMGRGAVLGGRTIARELERHLGAFRFEHLPIPVAVVATDLATGEAVVIDHGPVAEAVRASMALPGIFYPVFREGRILIDGGAVMPVPVEAARRLASTLPVVAINLQGDYLRRSEAVGLSGTTPLLSSFGVLRSAIGLTMAHLARQSLRLCPPDLELSLPVGHIDIGNFTRADELIAIGRDAAEAALPQIRALMTAR